MVRQFGSGGETTGELFVGCGFVRNGTVFMTRAILVNFHKYTNFGKEYYEPILDFFLQNMRKYQDEYDKLYLLDSNWEVNPEKVGSKVEVIKTNPNVRYYDTFKEVLPSVSEDLVLFLDNDTVIYREGVIGETFELLESVWDHDLEESMEPYDVVSITDQIGTYKTDKLRLGNKFCPYWFATRKVLLKRYKDVEWGPNMPEHETFGKLTEVMLADGLKPYEFEEDKSNCLFDGTQDGEKGKDLGYYHIRAGSTPAYLLATKEYGNRETYEKYLKEQPKNEYLRQFAWYEYMCSKVPTDLRVVVDIAKFLSDVGVTGEAWTNYYERFEKYHGL